MVGCLRNMAHSVSMPMTVAMIPITKVMMALRSHFNLLLSAVLEALESGSGVGGKAVRVLLCLFRSLIDCVPRTAMFVASIRWVVLFPMAEFELDGVSLPVLG